MILFNFILFSKLGQHYNPNFLLCNWQTNKRDTNFNTEDFVKYLFYKKNTNMVSSNIRLTNTKEYINLLLNEGEKNAFLSRSFWQKLVNNYIKETIFISPSNSLSTSYSNKLRSLNLSVYEGNEYQKFLHNFNRDLIKGKINVELNNLSSLTFSFPKQKRHIYLKYTWSKLLNFGAVYKYKQKTVSSFMNSMMKFFNSALPLFIVINNNKEIIVSESTQQVSNGRIFLNFFKPRISNTNTYTGLLFINPQDALEYKNYIEAKYMNSTRKINIQVVPTNMSLYYRLMNLENTSIEFRLVPDLEEISNLMYVYKKYDNISFNESQKYGRNFFQGQPLYIIEPLRFKRSNKENIVSFNDLFYSKNNNRYLNYHLLFLNYNTMIEAWNKLRSENPEYKLANKPKVSVFNLEAFIKEKNNKKNYNKIIFLPSYKTYSFIRHYLNANFSYQKDIQHWVFNQGLNLKTLCMRVFWSLTSRQPINW